jgi:hypothetical protein
MNIRDARIGQRAKYREHEGEIIEVERANPSGYITIQEGNQMCYRDHAALFEPLAPDACESCQTHNSEIARLVGRITDMRAECDKQIAVMKQSRDVWRAHAQRHSRNAFYWREELTKLQKEALADSKSLGEVAKIYIQISPAVLAQIIAEREE